MQPDLMPPDDDDGISSVTTADTPPATIKLVLLDSDSGGATILEAVAVRSAGTYRLELEVTATADDSGQVGTILAGILRKWLRPS